MRLVGCLVTENIGKRKANGVTAHPPDAAVAGYVRTGNRRLVDEATAVGVRLLETNAGRRKSRGRECSEGCCLSLGGGRLPRASGARGIAPQAPTAR